LRLSGQIRQTRRRCLIGEWSPRLLQEVSIGGSKSQQIDSNGKPQSSFVRIGSVIGSHQAVLCQFLVTGGPVGHIALSPSRAYRGRGVRINAGIYLGRIGRLVPSPRDHPPALVLRHFEFLDRLLDRALLIRSIIDNAE
jgi:hypothetical protein